MYILGISAFYHDSAACLIKNGKIICAIQEERFTRIKHDPSFPTKSIKYCINKENISIKDISNIVFYEKPFLKFERLLETYLAFAPKGFLSFSKAMPVWIKDKLFQKSKILNELEKIFGNKSDIYEKILFSEHHLSHAASAFYPSKFNSAVILTLDGVGEWTTSSVSIGKGKDIKILKELNFPHSIGLLYSAFTYYTGFKVNSGEYKVMGLAPYGSPKYADLIKNKLVNISDDGSFQLDMSYFDFATGLKMTNNKFNRLFGSLPRKSESEITQKDMDLAASIQKVVEEIFLKIVKNIAKETKEKNLCLAGGVALNCVANGVLLKEDIFKNIWIQPASGDAGGAIGAALITWHMYHKKDREFKMKSDSMRGSYLGPQFSNDEIKKDLLNCNAKFQKLDTNLLVDKVTEDLVAEKAVGWMQGNMEFGPRSLGNRSIIADPRSPKMQKQLNLKVKYRESFRPFAPSVLYEHANKWFDINIESPYMLFVANVKKDKCLQINEKNNKLFGIEKLNVPRSIIPAVTHIDYSARIQTVHKDTNPIYHKLISKFYDKTNCPVLVNTSFNVRGEPIVCSPLDAFKCFMGTELDVLVIGNFYLLKQEQNNQLIENYKDLYELD